MKKHVSFYIISTLLAAMLLLIIGCNTDTEGVFTRIRNSVVKVDVGEVTLISESNGGLIAFAKNKGIVLYNPANTSAWSILINSSTDLPQDATQNMITKDLVSSPATSITTPDLYFATSAIEDANNFLYRYTGSSDVPYSTTDYDDDYQILRMTPKADLMVVYDDPNLDTIEVVKPSSTPIVAGFAPGLPFTEIHILAIDDNTYVLTGMNSKAKPAVYNHILVTGAPPATSTDIANFSSIIIGFQESGSNYLFILNNGDVYSGTTLAGADKWSGTLPLASTSVPFRTLPILKDSTNNKLYVQGDLRKIYELNMTAKEVTDVSDEFPSDLVNVDITSFLSTATKNYVGTKENGIIEFTFPD